MHHPEDGTGEASVTYIGPPLAEPSSAPTPPAGPPPAPPPPAVAPPPAPPRRPAPYAPPAPPRRPALYAPPAPSPVAPPPASPPPVPSARRPASTAAPATPDGRHPAQWLALAAGMLLVLTGLAGLATAGLDGGLLGGLLGGSMLLSVVHLALGGAGLGLWSRPYTAQVYGAALAALYGGMVFYGLVVAGIVAAEFLPGMTAVAIGFFAVVAFAGLIVASALADTSPTRWQETWVRFSTGGGPGDGGMPLPTPRSGGEDPGGGTPVPQPAPAFQPAASPAAPPAPAAPRPADPPGREGREVARLRVLRGSDTIGHRRASGW